MPRSFRILGTLGRGAFGEVHLTEIRTDDDFVQTLAVKWLHAEYSEDPELAGRLRDEARLLGLLDHPHIVRVQGLTRLDGRLAVLMEAIHGRDLSGQHLSARATAEVCGAVAEALHAAWTAVPPGREEPLRVVHRDIKPSNIMVTQHGQVKVMDFGVARATFESREAQTRSQQYGTARYMAPERWLEGIAEAPSDVFSLGVTLVELVSGKPMPRARLSRQGFTEDTSEALDTVLDVGLRSLATKMLAFDPDERPTAETVSKALAALDLPGVPLKQWAASIEIQAPVASDKTGTVIVEHTGDTIALTATGSNLPKAAHAMPTSPPPTSWRLVGGMSAALFLSVPLIWWLMAPVTPPGRTDDFPTIAPNPPAPAPTAKPKPAPPEPEAANPEPIKPTLPTPVPAKRPRPAPDPEPQLPPQPEPVPRVPITFVLDPGVSASTNAGPIRAPRGTTLLAPGTIARIEVKTTKGPKACTIAVGATPSTWFVHADGRCTEGH